MTRLSKQINIEDVSAFIANEASKEDLMDILMALGNKFGWRIGLEDTDGKMRGLIFGTKEFMDEHWPDMDGRIMLVKPSHEN